MLVTGWKRAMPCKIALPRGADKVKSPRVALYGSPRQKRRDSVGHNGMESGGTVKLMLSP